MNKPTDEHLFQMSEAIMRYFYPERVGTITKEEFVAGLYEQPDVRAGLERIYESRYKTLN